MCSWIRHAGCGLSQGSREVFVTGDGARTSFERRPHLAHFLASVSALFEVAVFTAGSQVCRPLPAHMHANPSAFIPCSAC